MNQTRIEQDGKELMWTQEMNHYPCWSEDVKRQILSQCTVCQSYSISNFRISLFLNFNILKNCFVTIRIYSFFSDGQRDVNVVVTYWTDVMFYEKRKCQPDETMISMVKRDQPKLRRSKDKVKVCLLILLSNHFTLFCFPLSLSVQNFVNRFLNFKTKGMWQWRLISRTNVTNVANAVKNTKKNIRSVITWNDKDRIWRFEFVATSGVASSISEGDTFIYSCSAQLISFEIKSILKEVNCAEHKYIIYVCLCICMCIYMYVCILVSVYVNYYMHMYICVYMYACMYIYVCVVCKYVCMCIHI